MSGAGAAGRGGPPPPDCQSRMELGERCFRGCLRSREVAGGAVTRVARARVEGGAGEPRGVAGRPAAAAEPAAPAARGRRMNSRKATAPGLAGEPCDPCVVGPRPRVHGSVGEIPASGGSPSNIQASRVTAASPPSRDARAFQFGDLGEGELSCREALGRLGEHELGGLRPVLGPRELRAGGVEPGPCGGRSGCIAAAASWSAARASSIPGTVSSAFTAARRAGRRGSAWPPFASSRGFPPAGAGSPPAGTSAGGGALLARRLLRGVRRARSAGRVCPPLGPPGPPGVVGAAGA